MDLLEGKTVGGHSVAPAVLDLPRPERQGHEAGVAERYAAALRRILEGHSRKPSPQHGRRRPPRRIHQVWYCL